MDDSLLQLGRAVLAAQGFSRLIGAELTACSDDGIEIRLKMRDDFRQQYGSVHGGVLCYLADNSLTFAGGVVMKANVVTAELTINYLRPAFGSELIARAKAISCGRTQAVARCEIYSLEDDRERLCAAGQGMIALAGRASPAAALEGATP